MKKISLSLSTALLIASSAVANTNLVDALTTNSKVGGEIRFLYEDGNHNNVKMTDPMNDMKTASAAIQLDYTTGSYHGFKLVAAIVSAYDFGIHDKDYGSEDDPKNSITATAIHELFLEYEFGKSDIKIGRQEIKSPLISTSYGFPMRDSWDAAVLTLNELDNTLIKLICVDKWDKRYDYDSDGAPARTDTEFEDGLWSVYIKNNSYKPFTIEGQFMRVGEQQEGMANNGDGPINTDGEYYQYLTRANYALPFFIPLNFEAYYAGAKFDIPSKKNGADSTWTYGTKLTAKTSENLKLSVAYNEISDKRDYIGTLGHPEELVAYGFNIFDKNLYAGQRTYSFVADHNAKNLRNTLMLTRSYQGNEGRKNTLASGVVGNQNTVTLNTRWDMSWLLEGLSTWTTLSYAVYEEDTYTKLPDGDGNEATLARVFVSYKF